MSKEQESKKEYILYKESLWQAIVEDIFTFGVLLISFWVNQKYIESKTLSVIIVIMWLLFLFGKAVNKKNTFTDKDKLIKYIKEL